MNGAGVKQSPTITDPEILEPGAGVEELEAGRDRVIAWLRLLWSERRFLARAVVAGIIGGLFLAFYLPNEYQASTRLMPPDPQSTSGMAMMAAMAAKPGGGLASVAGDLLGLKSSGALFIGVLRSQTSQDRLIQEFDLRRVYGKRLVTDARMRLDENTSILEDRKSGIITISVTDHSPQRAAALARAYVDQLNWLVSELSTSSAHRERVFLEERLKVAKQDLDNASNQLAQFSSKNNTLDIQTEGKAMLDAAGTIAGQMIAARSELEGLRQIYTDNNPRVRSLNARVAELRKQLDKLGGTDGDAARAANSSPEVSNGMPYPTIRSLPLLGAKYADYYRGAKIQETVYELLTEQYELAKVQEVKETPSVKILDHASVPERKSYPPRLEILLLCMLSGLAVSIVWVFGQKRWHEAEANNPGKVLATEVFETVNAHMPWTAPNGSRVQAMSHRVWLRLRRQQDSAKVAEEPPTQP
jgi:capsule polysaccharide export protein KpsE/RkpR